MIKNPAFIYAYSFVSVPEALRWKGEEQNSSPFFGNIDEARRAVLALREKTCREFSWEPVRLEKIQTLPLTPQTLLTLINHGVGAIIESYDILELIEG